MKCENCGEEVVERGEHVEPADGEFTCLSLEDVLVEYFQLHGFPEEHSRPSVAAKVMAEFITDRMKVRFEHELDCPHFHAVNAGVGIQCEHGYDVCPICDPCTCHQGLVVITEELEDDSLRQLRGGRRGCLRHESEDRREAREDIHPQVPPLREHGAEDGLPGAGGHRLGGVG